MPPLLAAITAILTTYSFVPSELLHRTWIKPSLVERVTDTMQVLYIHRSKVSEARLTLWEGPATALIRLGTYVVTSELEFVDMLVDCGWL